MANTKPKPKGESSPKQNPPAVRSLADRRPDFGELGRLFVSAYYDILPVSYASSFLSQLQRFDSIVASRPQMDAGFCALWQLT